MTTGEEGITSDLMVEFWASSGADVEPGWTDAGGDSTGASATAAEWVLSTWTLAEGSGPF